MNTKPNRDITAEILKEFELALERLGNQMYPSVDLPYDENTFEHGVNEGLFQGGNQIIGLKEKVAQALTKQKEEIVKSLRIWKLHNITKDNRKEEGWNEAVDEFNSKLDKLT